MKRFSLWKTCLSASGLVTCLILGVAQQAVAEPPSLWSYTFNGAGNGADYNYGVAIDSQGNTIVAGSNYTGATNGTNGRAVKYTPAGDVHCSISLDSGLAETGWCGGNCNTSNDYFSAVAVDFEDNILLTGVYTGNYSINGYLQAAYTQKYDEDCKPLWNPARL